MSAEIALHGLPVWHPQENWHWLVHASFVGLILGLVEGMGMVIGLGVSDLLDSLLPDVDADVDIDYNLEIETLNVTGGVIEFVTADLIGAKKAGTAITDDGTNSGEEADLIDVEAVANTAGTAVDGYMGIYAQVQTQLGL